MPRPSSPPFQTYPGRWLTPLPVRVPSLPSGDLPLPLSWPRTEPPPTNLLLTLQADSPSPTLRLAATGKTAHEEPLSLAETQRRQRLRLGMLH